MPTQAELRWAITCCDTASRVDAIAADWLDRHGVSQSHPDPERQWDRIEHEPPVRAPFRGDGERAWGNRYTGL